MNSANDASGVRGQMVFCICKQVVRLGEVRVVSPSADKKHTYMSVYSLSAHILVKNVSFPFFVLSPCGEKMEDMKSNAGLFENILQCK